jgi:hypothetical protein
MRCWNVERFEVVPIGFDFRTFSNGEAHADKYIDESVPGLCDQMQRTALRQFEQFSEIEALGSDSRGTLYSFTRVHVAPGAFRGDTPYAIGIVDLDDGPRLMCRMIGEVGTQHLDQPVQMLVLDYDDGPLFGARVLPTAR